MPYVEPVMRMLYALTGEWEFLNSITELAGKQEKGDDVTMCEVVDKFVARGIQQGLRVGATAFVKASISRGDAMDYVLGMVQECFGFSEENADALYRECMM